jgi:hypothetical protein
MVKMLWESRGGARNLPPEFFDLLPDPLSLPAIELKQKQPAISSSWRTIWESLQATFWGVVTIAPLSALLFWIGGVCAPRSVLRLHREAIWHPP